MDLGAIVLEFHWVHLKGHSNSFIFEMLIFTICWKLHPLQVFKLMMRNLDVSFRKCTNRYRVLNIYFGGLD